MWRRIIMIPVKCSVCCPAQGEFSMHPQFSRSVLSDSLRPHGRQHARLPCPLPAPRSCIETIRLECVRMGGPSRGIVSNTRGTCKSFSGAGGGALWVTWQQVSGQRWIVHCDCWWEGASQHLFLLIGNVFYLRKKSHSFFCDKLCKHIFKVGLSSSWKTRVHSHAEIMFKERLETICMKREKRGENCCT